MEIAPSKKAPDFRLENISGKEVSLSDFLGKVVYIDFWGTWCGPCIKAIPKHLKLQKSIKNAKFGGGKLQKHLKFEMILLPNIPKL